jgi:hypothetical protein
LPCSIGIAGAFLDKLAMKIKSIQTDGEWIAIGKNQDDLAQDPGFAETKRVLSAAVRSQNLVILAGLGTSLCVNESGKRLAPTMGDLIQRTEQAFSTKDRENNEFGDQGGRWTYFKRLAQVDTNCSDLELLLSRAKVAVDFLEGDAAKHVADLLQLAEDVIRREVDFLSADTDLSVHSAFLRRIARRSSRRARVKLFTTNYDKCFEQAAQSSGFVVVDGFAFGIWLRRCPTVGQRRKGRIHREPISTLQIARLGGLGNQSKNQSSFQERWNKPSSSDLSTSDKVRDGVQPTLH